MNPAFLPKRRNLANSRVQGCRLVVKTVAGLAFLRQSFKT